MTKRPIGIGAVALKRREMSFTIPLSIAAAAVIGLKVDPSSYTLCVTLLRSASELVPVSLLGLYTGSETIAMTSPVCTSSTTPVAPRAWKPTIAWPSSLSIAACTRESIDSASGWPRLAGSTSCAS